MAAGGRAIRGVRTGGVEVIVGRGLLARAFAPRYGHAPGIVVFASGVSNSSETDEAAFLREQDLLQRSLAEPAADVSPEGQTAAGSVSFMRPSSRRTRSSIVWRMSTCSFRNVLTFSRP